MAALLASNSFASESAARGSFCFSAALHHHRQWGLLTSLGVQVQTCDVMITFDYGTAQVSFHAGDTGCALQLHWYGPLTHP